jgi:predicted PurR-regulated permease PerM
LLARPLWILAVCGLVVVLRQTREALIPLVLAILITLIFSGVVEGLKRLHVPRAVSALVLVLAVLPWAAQQTQSGRRLRNGSRVLPGYSR